MMLRNIKLTIEYDGTYFEGWQVQRENQKTVQGEIEKALKKILKEKIRITGSGRTDSGVHALGQVANFKTKSEKKISEILNALNGNLTKDIVILKAEDAPLDFHAQYSVKTKTYRYTILNRETRCAQQKKLCLFYPYKLNLRLMREEAKCLVGLNDFKSFQASDPARRLKQKKGSTVRTIKKIDIRKKGDYIYIDIEANGFLYKMVRNIVGTLLEIGHGRLLKGSMKQILSQKNRDSAGYAAKAKGLSLLQVTYGS